jgi:membrane protein implicated in regulation of membrane protease activity
MPWWGWLLVGLGLVAVLVATAVTFRSQLSFAVKFARTLMSDQRVPRPLRWLIGVSLAIKVVPIPDFGVDEVVLIVVGLVLLTFYKPVLRAILEETRSVQADRVRGPLTVAPAREDPASR